MQPRRSKKSVILGFVIVFTLGMCAVSTGRLLAAEKTSVRIHVTDAQTDDPIFQAHITLRYRKSGGLLKRSKINSYSAKTDKTGWCKFLYIPKGMITVMVIAPEHATFGKQFEVKEDDQVIDVKLKKPQPVL